jgi:hypothetical protein
MNLRLFWSWRGEVACAIHAPIPDSPRWAGERWAEVPEMVRPARAIVYQCQHCSTQRTPIAHPYRANADVTERRDTLNDGRQLPGAGTRELPAFQLDERQ